MLDHTSSPPTVGPLGHLPAFMVDPVGFLQRCRQCHGPVVALRLGGPVLLVTSPQDIEHILVTRAENYVKCRRIVGYPGNRIWGDSLLALEGEAHRRRRITLAPLFANDPVQEYLRLWEETLDRELPTWTGGASEGLLRPRLSRLARQGIMMMLTGRPAGAPLLAELERRRAWIEVAIRRRLVLPDPSSGLRRAFSEALSNPSPRGMIARWHHEGRRLPEEAMLAELLTLSVSGFESTLELLEWSLWALDSNPREMRRLQDGELSAAQVIEETLRLYPPTWMFVRVACQADRLPSGAAVSSGTRIYLSQYVTQRDGEIWPDPDRFAPGRERPHRLAAYPFGAGARRCPAEALARAQVARFLERWVGGYRFVVFGSARQRPVGRLALSPARPNHLWATPRAERARTSQSFSLVVPTYNRPEAVERLLESLLIQDYPAEKFEIVLVNDGGKRSLEPTVDKFRSSLQIRLVELERNHGPGPARHQGVAQARFPQLAFSDDDCRPSPTWLQEMCEVIERHPQTAVGGRTINALQDNLWAEATQQLLTVVHEYYRDDERARYFATNNLVLPANLYGRLDSWRGGWRLSGAEDRLFCQAWARQGFAMRYAPDALVLHYHDLTPLGFWDQHLRYGRGGRRYCAMGGERMKVGNGFFSSVLLRPIQQSPDPRGLSISLRIALAQVATFCGYLLESLAPYGSEAHG